MTTTKTRPTRARTAAPKKAAPRKAAPKAARPQAAPKPAPEPEPAPALDDEATNPVAGAYKRSMGFMESTVTGVLGIPLTVASTLGVPSEATDMAKGGQQVLTKTFSGAFDGMVTSVTGLAGKAPGLVGGMMSSATKLLP